MPKTPKPKAVPAPPTPPSRASFISRGSVGGGAALDSNRALLASINPLLGKSSINVGRPSALGGA